MSPRCAASWIVTFASNWAGVGSGRLEWGNVPHPETESLFSHVNVGVVNANSKFVGQGAQNLPDSRSTQISCCVQQCN
jgi:hypothetical protein